MAPVRCSSAFAKAPSVCVAELQKDYGATPALRSTCENADCTFQASEGNASALALIDTIVKRAETCMGQAGLTMVKEEKTEGLTRYYGAPGAAEQCALLTAPGSGAAQGVRLTCQAAKTSP